MPSLRAGWLLALFALASVGCRRGLTEPLALAERVDAEGQPIAGTAELLSPALLEEGHDAYLLHCSACHGERGDGFGPAAPGMRPPPRNFAQGLFKFPGTGYGKLPADSALERTIRRGLHGTPMRPWDVSPAERRALIAYLKTLSPRWREEGVPPELELSFDPWRGREEEAVALGRRVFHLAQGGAGCSACHPAYLTRAELSALAERVTGAPVAEFPPEPHRSALKASEYPAVQSVAWRGQGCEALLSEAVEGLAEATVELDGLPVAREEWSYTGSPPKLTFSGRACEVLTRESPPSVLLTRPHQLLPPDFLFHPVKSIGPAESQREDLYRTIGAGIGGAGMPGWKGVLEEEQLWALVYYVQSLIALRGTPEGAALRERLEADLPAR